MKNPSRNVKRDPNRLDECILPNESEPIIKKKMNYWLYLFLIVYAAYRIEDHIVPRESRPNEPDTENTNGTEKMKEDQKWILTILCKATERKSVNNTIIRTKENGYNEYSAVIDCVGKYGAEGGAVT